MGNITVNLTVSQLSELYDRVETMVETGCVPGSMAEHYGLNKESLDELDEVVGVAFNTAYKSKRARLVLSEMQAKALMGELENAADIARDNSDDGDRDFATRAARFTDGAERILWALNHQ